MRGDVGQRGPAVELGLGEPVAGVGRGLEVLAPGLAVGLGLTQPELVRREG